MKMAFKDFFSKKGDGINNKGKNKKLTGDDIKIRVFRMINGSPIETYVFTASQVKGDDNNTILINEDMNFKEEFPGVQDYLISDIEYKLESRGLSKENQLEKVKKAIGKQMKIIDSEKNGKIDVDGDSVKVNINTEKQRLRLLKCVKYNLENKRGEGYYECIEVDGSRCLSYLIRDGELIPYWYKTPDNDGEPVTLVPDIVQRKKYYKERVDEIVSDFNQNRDTKFMHFLKLAGQVLIVLLIIGNIFWAFQNMKWTERNANSDPSKALNDVRIQCESVRQECGKYIANQVDNNEVLINVGKKYLEDGLVSEGTGPNSDKGDIQI